MGRTAWLQDRRMKKFLDVLGRYEKRKLSALEAGESLGCSERQFRRWRDRYEEEGLDGPIDKRLGKASAKRDPAAAGVDAGAVPPISSEYELLFGVPSPLPDTTITRRKGHGCTAGASVAAGHPLPFAYLFFICSLWARHAGHGGMGDTGA